MYINVCLLTREFNDMITPILEQIYLENNEGYEVGNISINLGNVCSNIFFLYINIPTHHTSWSKTLKSTKIKNNLDNKFCQAKDNKLNSDLYKNFKNTAILS